MNRYDTITPQDLGLPDKFKSFRLPQREALEWFDSCAEPITAACLPTGVGKTSLAVALAKILGVKATYLVATKALEAQVLGDFDSIGMRNVHGRANYKCRNFGDCDKGLKNKPVCSRAETSECPYACAVEVAAGSSLALTNYAYWLWSRRTNNKAFAGTGLLICDEAHQIENQLSSFASIKLYRREMGKHIPDLKDPHGLSDDYSQDWENILVMAFKVDKTIEESTDDDDKDLRDRLARVIRMEKGWVWQRDDHGHLTFTPVHLAPYARVLFGSVPRVLLMSASLTPFVLKSVLPSGLSFDYRAWGQVFPGQNAPVYHIPTRKLSWRSTDEDYKTVIEAADRIMRGRRDRRGIIHTVSYARAKRALGDCGERNRFIWNDDGKSLAGALDRFRKAPHDAVLITPSVEEGFDFPGTECEYQIVLKFPFPNEMDRVVKERCRQIPGYRLHHAAQKIVQMRGRAVRSYDDRAEMFILDNAVKQLCGAEGRSYLPPGFRIFTVAQVPPAPPRMTRT
jgi:Rad3-related DNA helicase